MFLSLSKNAPYSLERAGKLKIGFKPKCMEIIFQPSRYRKMVYECHYDNVLKGIPNNRWIDCR